MPKQPFRFRPLKVTPAHGGPIPLAPARKTLRIPVPCARRAVLYEAELAVAYAALRSWGTGGAAPVAGRLRYAISGERLVGLLEDLAELLDDYVAYGVQEDFLPLGLGAGATYPGYFDAQIDAGPGVAGFFARYPLLQNAITRLRTYFVQNLDTALARVDADWNELERGFVDPAGGDVLRALIQVQPTGSDFHKRGKQVLILTFAYTTPAPPPLQVWQRRASSSERRAIARRTGNALAHRPWKVKVVYKPTDVEIDTRIMGDTARLAAARGAPGPEVPPIAQSLMELMNARLGLVPPNELPTYLIIPHNPGSAIAANPPGAALGNSYGYIQFLTHEPAQSTAGAPFSEANGLAQVQAACAAHPTWRAANPFDYVVATHAEAQEVFRHWGRLAAIAVVFSIADMHVENVIMHRNKPHLIDLEDSCKWRMIGVGQTGMFGAQSASCDADHAPNPLSNAKAHDRTPGLACGPLVGPAQYPNTVLYEFPAGGVLARVNKAGMPAELHAGFTQVFNMLANPGDNAIVDAWAMNNLPNVITRFVAMPTQEYYNQLWRFITGNLGVAPPLDPVAAGGPGPYAAQFANFHNWFYENRIHRERETWLGLAHAAAAPEEQRQWTIGYLPTFALEHPEANWLDLIQWDIPSFYRRLGQLDLLSSVGDALDPGAIMNYQDGRAAPWLAATGNVQHAIARVTYFANQPAADAAALAAGAAAINAVAQATAASNAVSGCAAAQAAAAGPAGLAAAAAAAVLAPAPTAASVATAAATAAANAAFPVRLQHWFPEPAVDMVRRQITSLANPVHNAHFLIVCLGGIP